MENLDLPDGAFIASDFDHQEVHCQYISHSMAWGYPPQHQPVSGAEDDDSNTAQIDPLRQYPYNQDFNGPGQLNLLGANCMLPLHQQSSHSYHQGTSATSYDAAYSAHLHASPLDFNAGGYQHIPTNLVLNPNLDRRNPIMAYSTPMEAFNPLAYYQNDLQTGLMGYPVNPPLHAPHTTPTGILSSSPTENWADDNSVIGSDSSWQVVEQPGTVSRQSFESYQSSPHTAAINPGLTLHIRTGSASSQSDVPQSANSFSSFEEIQWPMPSPQSEIGFELAPATSTPHGHSITPMHYEHTQHEHSPMQECSSPTSSMENAPSSLESTSPTSPTSPNVGSSSLKRRKSPTGKSSKVIAKKSTVATKKDSQADKRVGKRKGPLGPDERKKASEIRKLRACLRCKFLKKTCDTGDPCQGCQPSHVRLWQVPCTRVDIKDIGDFMKNWKADYERHVSLAFSVSNIQDYGQHEQTMFVTHGYGYHLQIQTRQVFVRDPDCFDVDWVESNHESPRSFEAPTASLTTGRAGISAAQVQVYLDQHLDRGFEYFVDKHFEGTPFLTEILKTAYRFYKRTGTPIIRQALKLVLAYNLTQHVTLVDGQFDPDNEFGRVEDESSNFFGQTLAPVMINFELKTVLAKLWRELQKDVLYELSNLYSKVYSGDKLKHWPTIFMLGCILLAIWEEMQFDAHYRSPDPASVEKFCKDMEATPVGVVVGLFSAISQKVPALNEWDTDKHGHILNSDVAVCDTMTEVRDHIERHEDYLKSRSDCKFDRSDFDSLSNKFLSKLVINTAPMAKVH